MAKAPKVARAHPLAGRQFAGNGVTLAPVDIASRVSLRAEAGALADIGKLLGFALPTRPKTSAAKGRRTALWLGPDEWLITDATNQRLAATLAKAEPAGCSVVDIAHRNTAIEVSGPNAAAALNAGCPQDLRAAAFAVGAASRTVLAKAEIVLLRTGEDAFRVECWRSFADYVWTYLVDAAKSA